MEQFKLTPEEMLAVELLILAGIENDKSLIFKYYKIPLENRTSLPVIISELQRKGVILKSFKIPVPLTTDFNFETIPFNSIFINKYHKFSGELGQELRNTYPRTAIVGGEITPMQNYAKYFNSEEEFHFAYGKAIGWKPEVHKQVLELIEWAKKNGGICLNMNIGAFVISKMWESIREYRDGGGSMLNFDSTKNI